MMSVQLNPSKATQLGIIYRFKRSKLFNVFKVDNILTNRTHSVYISFSQDLANEDNHNLEQVPIDEILEMQRDEQILKHEEEEKKKKSLIERGLQPHTDYHEDMY